MQVSDNCLKIIKEFEGFYSKAYKCPANVWTIGYGTTNADEKVTGFHVEAGKVVTKEKAEEMLIKTINKKYAPNVSKYDDKYHFNQNQFDALTSFCYNIGSIDKLVGKGKYDLGTIAKRMLLFNHANGKVLPGLTRRRKAEQELFLQPVKESKNKKVSSTANKSSKSEKYIVTCNSLNVRGGTGTSYKIVNTLHKGDEVLISNECGSWGKIANSNNYIHMSYVKKAVEYIITCDVLRVRSGPSMLYKTTSVLHKGDKVCICEKKGKWLRINNTKKWFNSKYAKKL